MMNIGYFSVKEIKHDWPYHVTSYIEKLKREDRKSDLLEMHTGE